MDAEAVRRLTDVEKRLENLATLERPRTNYGASNPTGWPNNVPYYRTDLGRWIYYDGTRWLTEKEYEQVLTPYFRNTQPYTGTATSLLLAPTRTDLGALVTRVKAYLDVAATNNGSNYWSFAFKYGTTSVYAFDTSANAAGVAILKENAPAAVVASPGAISTLDVTGKTGAPGSVVVNGTIWYRLIVT